MKRVFFLAVFAILGFAATAQTADELAQIRQILGKEKKDLIKQFMSLNEADAAKFWPLYDEYSEKRKALADDRIDILKDYADQYAGMNDDQSKALGKRYFKNESAILKLQEKYYNKMSKSVTPLKAMQFMQAENYIQTTLRSALQDAIPFIGEFEKSK
ncbi:MAG TPA: hypothetical protein VFX73_04180 [Chitinophagaceae bacterium]|nr:hypothetical protein [Chitinophagaceae bacterium]